MPLHESPRPTPAEIICTALAPRQDGSPVAGWAEKRTAAVLDALTAAGYVITDAAGEQVAPVPRKRGPLTASDVEALRLDLDAGTLLILVRDRASRAAAALSAVGAETALLGHEEAHLLWGAVGACLRTFPAEQPATEGPAS